MVEKIKTYDVVVIGSGAGMTAMEEALSSGASVALVDRGPLGGTCLNNGCFPSKILIYAADRVVEIQNSRKLGIEVEIKGIDFEAIMTRMRDTVKQEREDVRKSLGKLDNFDYYEGEGHFVKDYTVEVNGQIIKGKKVFIAAGARPVVPPIKGLEKIKYLTNESVLDLEHLPQSLVIIGGGYVGAEYAHFFAAMGCRVTIVEMTGRLLQGEEPDISALILKKMGQRMEILLNTQVLEFDRKDNLNAVVVKDILNGRRRTLTAEAVMIAVGRRPNSDTLKLENSGVDVDQRGFIRVDEYLETTQKQIYAFGDVIGKAMFTHAANREAMLVWHNATNAEPVRTDYDAVPHAVFTQPQIASVGLTREAASKTRKILIGEAKYFDTAKGVAMLEEDGFARAIVDGDSNKILGFHIVGPEASSLIQEVIDCMASGGDTEFIEDGMHIHPAMPEIIERALSNLKEVV